MRVLLYGEVAVGQGLIYSVITSSASLPLPAREMCNRHPPALEFIKFLDFIRPSGRRRGEISQHPGRVFPEGVSHTRSNDEDAAPRPSFI